LLFYFFQIWIGRWVDMHGVGMRACMFPFSVFFFGCEHSRYGWLWDRGEIGVGGDLVEFGGARV
jgi:hypothetical protein